MFAVHPLRKVADAYALRDRGLTAGVIACELGVPRSTVRGWLSGGRAALRLATTACERCGAPSHRFDGLPPAYAYLLGLYLGDGCISEHARSVYRLRIHLDLRYPRIIDACEAAIHEVLPKPKVARMKRRSNYVANPEFSHVEVSCYSKSWPCLFPQHGPGRKHQRLIELADWQWSLVENDSELLLKGLIHSDGCRFINSGKNWSCPRYSFSNRSQDIRDIFCRACELVGVHYTFAPHTVYVSRKADVARLDEFIGPKV